ncbi:X-Pro dipeptidyl-peptidase (S15 family) [Musa troglodytarum]|uniref:X-Pro dipeptidyl-peptidase (S15 family) n=1 Tax=Musa troglodytarum TaxID=320322 RepID=A0A9E7H0R3_9LILI|nr:X-Pro dipeptidyl-peptidase (S15 family) [Musa troglodytarum]
MMVGMESMTVETGDGVKVHARLFKPAEPPANDLVVVLVHVYTGLGGFQGLLKGIATGLAERGFRAVTFDMRGASRASLFGSAEIQDAIAVCKWASKTLAPRGIILVGSSAGAPIAGRLLGGIRKPPSRRRNPSSSSWEQRIDSPA